MAITKVAQYLTAPTTLANGYTAQNLHLQAFINQVTAQAFILTDPVGTAVPTIQQGCYISDGGTLYIVDTADYAILGTAVDGNNYIKMSISGDTLTATWIQNITGYAYNNIYGYLASGTDILLPYLIVKASAVYTKYRNDIVLPSFTNQNLKTTDAVAFATVNTGQGANELYGMNQGVKTTDSPHFANINPPVDNNDATLPAIGVGGFTFGVAGSAQYWTMPANGTYICVVRGGEVERVAGGGTTAAYNTFILIFRIA